MKTVRVVAAVIKAVNENGEPIIFATQRGYGEFNDTIEYDYPTFHLSMDCFWCEIVKGDLVLKEHEAARWLNKKSIDDVEWLPADITLIEKVRERL